MARQIHESPVTCRIASGETLLVQRNANLYIPVELAPVVSSDDNPVVRALRSNATVTNIKRVFGQFVGVDDAGLARVIVRGKRVRFRRHTSDQDAITAADLGKGIIAPDAANQNGYIEAGGSAAGALANAEVGFIVGGNTSDGTTDNPAYFDVQF